MNISGHLQVVIQYIGKMSEQRRRRKEGNGSEESDLSETEAPVARQKKKPVGLKGFSLSVPRSGGSAV